MKPGNTNNIISQTSRSKGFIAISKEMLRERRPSLWVMLMAGVLLLLAAYRVMSSAAGVREEATRLDQELAELRAAQTSRVEHVSDPARWMSVMTELAGWQRTRVVFTPAIQRTLQARTDEVEIKRITIQQAFSNGGREEGLDYLPRFRSNRLTIAGTARGIRYEAALDRCVAALSAPECFGSTFGQLKRAGKLQTKPGVEGIPAFDFLIDATSAERRIDPLSEVAP